MVGNRRTATFRSGCDMRHHDPLAARVFARRCQGSLEVVEIPPFTRPDRQGESHPVVTLSEASSRSFYVNPGQPSSSRAPGEEGVDIRSLDQGPSLCYD